MEKRRKAKKVICILDGGQQDSCPPPADGRLPLCEKHIAELNRDLRLSITDGIKGNFMEKGDESVIFNQKDGSVYSLNATATFIFKELLGGKDFCTILADINDLFKIEDIKEIMKDCRQFIKDILNTGLVKAADER